MLKFLKSLNTPKNKTLYVIGNQSADMDSCCSALVASFFLKINGYDQVQPCINIPRGDLNLRSDIKWLFAKLEIPLEKIHFRDDNWESPQNSLFLVDHNSPTVEGNVVGIIDHHQPEGKQIDCDPKIIGTTGSCVSLVIDYFKNNDGWDDPVLAALAIFPIVQDTNNLKSEKKTTGIDVSSYNFVKPHVELDVADTTKVLKSEKDNTAGFTAQDLFNKDYKNWDDIGISSVPMLLAEALTAWPELAQEMVAFKQANKLSYFFVMGNGKINKERAREIATVGNELRIDEVSELELTLQRESHGVYFFNQGNTDASRKQVAPIVRKLAHRI